MSYFLSRGHAYSYSFYILYLTSLYYIIYVCGQGLASLEPSIFDKRECNGDFVLQFHTTLCSVFYLLHL